MRSKIPKIISGILAIMLIVWLGYALLPPARFWIAFEFVSAVLVAVGCVGELCLFHLPSGRLKREKEKHHHLESRFILAVAVGVTMELFALSHAISEATRLEQGIASANERAGIAEQKAGEANERAANTESNNLVLQAKVLELEAKSRWRTITPEKEKAFIELTKNNLKLPIRVRMGNSSSAEVQSFAARIRAVLDKAGFVETNADQAIEEWPPELNMLWTGVGPELPPIIFVSNPAMPGKIVDLRNAQKQLKSYASYATNTFVKTEFAFVNDDSNPEAYVTDENGSPILHIKFTDRAPFQITAFIAAQNAFGAIGIPSGYVTITNIPIGAFEIFVNPK